MTNSYRTAGSIPAARPGRSCARAGSAWTARPSRPRSASSRARPPSAWTARPSTAPDTATLCSTSRGIRLRHRGPQPPDRARAAAAEYRGLGLFPVGRLDRDTDGVAAPHERRRLRPPRHLAEVESGEVLPRLDRRAGDGGGRLGLRPRASRSRMEHNACPRNSSRWRPGAASCASWRASTTRSNACSPRAESPVTALRRLSIGALSLRRPPSPESFVSLTRSRKTLL